ncbi:hypothetical protein SEVIR_3G014650v4 [Setaria viridis]|uniref:Uncharacterized protein n=1 Tax=Setaria viridis TaxID=4556 RepID=A0A4U6V464_SETVI|nr:hypothetical protein SEVIR_3G014650v2 [Setaria viridis]
MLTLVLLTRYLLFRRMSLIRLGCGKLTVTGLR